ncbi:hypothetical protein [Sandarakinorhabdus sp.]|uniref:hypothetical protein n=1 Tax=Sandarakinorhabdus sp. TaxID=1916663 RepID=UPI0028AE76AA|nr:hypothetical protein [Sandarakinorhabdus sp.]
MDITYEKMSGALGSLLLVWAALERSLRSEIIRAKRCVPEGTHGVGGLLKCWECVVTEKHPADSLGPLLARALQDQLQGPREVRNGLCHGLVGISAATEKIPAKLRWKINDKSHSISWAELQEQFAWLSKLPGAVSLISNPSFGSRATNNAENREWWRSVYAIDLPEP